MTEARKGKVARLPYPIRKQVNLRLRDGQGEDMLPWLNGLPEVQHILADQFAGEAITPQNLSNWRQGGYLQWLKGQEDIERAEQLTEFASRLAEATGGAPGQAAVTVVTGRILQILETMPEEGLLDAAKAIATLRATELQAGHLVNDNRRLAGTEEKLRLDRERFEVKTCELFLAWAKDSKALAIVESAVSNADKIAALRKTYFSDVDALEESGEIQLPK